MCNIYLFNRKGASTDARSIPNILAHRLNNVCRVERGEKPIDFWDTVPELLAIVKAHAKKNNESLYAVKEKVEITITIGIIKEIEYVY